MGFTSKFLIIYGSIQFLCAALMALGLKELVPTTLGGYLVTALGMFLLALALRVYGKLTGLLSAKTTTRDDP